MLLPRVPAVVTAAFAASAMACSGAADGPLDRSSDEAAIDPGTPEDVDVEAEVALGNPDSTNADTIARVVVERSRSLDGNQSAQAMAHFVELTADADHTLELVGLHSAVERPGQPCRTDFSARTASAAPVELALLDAGAVEIRLQPDDGLPASVVTLAPHAFPSVSSFASGLVYTTRDRSAETLPSGARYEVRVDGARSIPSLGFAGEAPEELSEVTLGGVPLRAVRELDAAAPLDITWDVGRAGDVVLVEFANPDDGVRRVSCSFADELGAATLAPQLLALTQGKARLSLRRVRELEAALDVAEPAPGTEALLRGELRFDFEVNRALVVGDRVVTEPVDADALDGAPSDAASSDAASSDAEHADSERPDAAPFDSDAERVDPEGGERTAAALP